MATFAQDGAFRAAPSGGDFSADGTGQYRGVKLAVGTNADTGTVVLCGANDPDFAGVLQDTPATGETATYKTRDVTWAIAGAAIVLTDELTTDAAGRFVPATTGQFIVGRPVSAAAASGNKFSLEIRPGGIK
ncbi:MAG TPA: capsid cement protein [Acidimicrobiales bacterium]|jgi:hypothetical protein|nr:capsid cement protein [Acidimicrobiales bacterium]